MQKGAGSHDRAPCDEKMMKECGGRSNLPTAAPALITLSGLTHRTDDSE